MTNPAKGARGRARASIAVDDGWFADVHGQAQWVTARGRSRANPPLLLLSGPGAAFSPLQPVFEPWEGAFTVCHWDQPWSGATWVRAGEARKGPLTFDRLVRDAIVVSERLLRRLGARRLILVGASGGSILGLMMLRRRPDLFAAHVGTGQIVHWARQEALSYAMILEAARSRSDSVAMAELEGIGPPPWPDAETDAIKARYSGAFTPAEQAALDAAAPTIQSPPAGARHLAPLPAAPDPRALGMAAYKALRAEITGFDAWRLGSRFERPVLFFQGERDLYTPTAEVAAYADWIDAPAKRLALVEGGGHGCVFLARPFLGLLERHVRPLATTG